MYSCIISVQWYGENIRPPRTALRTALRTLPGTLITLQKAMLAVLVGFFDYYGRALPRAFPVLYFRAK